ncbi:hypothetical protein HYV85_02610 [Candidatus Woesearchaeota archaeon]|nr:hypothetical protein [Candidatus Woesearchaeota archaeon]
MNPQEIATGKGETSQPAPEACQPLYLISAVIDALAVVVKLFPYAFQGRIEFLIKHFSCRITAGA